jgi:tetratricopeptide (TPR) repeat protein
LIPLFACATLGGCGGPKPTVTAQKPALPTSIQHPAEPAARIQLAERYVRSGDTFGAIEQLEVVRTLGDRTESLALRLAGLYDTLGEPEAAANVLATFAVKPSATSTLYLAYSRELLKLGEFTRAADALDPLIAQWQVLPNDTRQYIARTLLLAGEAERAGKLIPVDSAGSDAEWLALHGLQTLLSGQPKVAAAALTRSVALDAQNGDHAYLLGRAWLASGVPDRALQAWSMAMALPNAPPQAAIGVARLLIQANHVDEAARLIQSLGSVANQMPAYWQVQSLLAQQGKQTTLSRIALGYAAYHNGDPWQAEAIWREALPHANAEDAWALYTALLNSAAQRQDRISVSYATVAAKRFPDDYHLLKSRAELLLRQNARAEALAVAQRLPPLEPPDQAGQAADLLAQIALILEREDLLRRSVQREREQAPRNPNALLHLIEWQHRQQWTPANLESTLKLCQEAIAIAPESAEAYFRAGEALKSLNRPQEAMTMLRHALTLAPRLHDGSPNALLAQIEQREGLLEESRYEFGQARRLNQLRDPWPTQMELLYRDHPAPTLDEWRTLARLALDRHQPWNALCATTRALRLAPDDVKSLRMRAAALSRLGRPDEALTAMRAVTLLTAQTSSAKSL